MNKPRHNASGASPVGGPDPLLGALAAAQAVLRGGHGRDRPLHAPQAPVLSMLAEIGETILPRRLTFSAADGRTLLVEAADRRLVRVLDMTPEDLRPDAYGDLPLGTGLTDDVAEAAVACLVTFAEDAASPVVAAGPIPPSEKVAEGGIAIDVLKAAAELDEEEPEAEQVPDDHAEEESEPEAEDDAEAEADDEADADEPEINVDYATLTEALRATLLGAKLHGLAFMTKRGRVDVAAEQKPFPVADFLRAGAKDHAGGLPFVERLVPGERLVLLAGKEPGDPCIAMGRDGEESMAAGFDTERLAEVAALWRAFSLSKSGGG